MPNRNWLVFMLGLICSMVPTGESARVRGEGVPIGGREPHQNSRGAALDYCSWDGQAGIFFANHSGKPVTGVLISYQSVIGSRSGFKQMDGLFGPQRQELKSVNWPPGCFVAEIAIKYDKEWVTWPVQTYVPLGRTVIIDVDRAGAVRARGGYRN